MKITHYGSDGAGHDFHAEVAGGCVLFRCPPDFAATGCVESYTGDQWPGNYQDVFAVETDGEFGTAPTGRIRLTAAGIAACCAAMAGLRRLGEPGGSGEPEACGGCAGCQTPCQCDLCRDAEAVA